MVTLKIPKDCEHFKEVFLDKYFLSSLKGHKEFEFQQLRQGGMSVEEYAKRFEDMVSYSRQASHEPDERWKIDHLCLVLEDKSSTM